jgi:hypothetical protein
VSFLSPLFLAGALTAAVPLILHLLKREPEPRVKFAAVRLLKNAPVEHTERRRLRELILLALRVATLVLLALAFARPFFVSGAAIGSSGVTMIALDTSYSMDAPGRFERAKQLAKERIDRAPIGDLIGVIMFADRADLVASPSPDRALARASIDEARPGTGATRYRAALSAAAQSVGDRRGTIVVVTDLQENGWDSGDRAAVPEGAKVEILDVGPMPSNLSVTSVRPLPDRVVATLHNTGPDARQAHAHLRIDDRPAGEATVTVGVNQTAEVVFPGAPKGTSASVAVDDAEGLQADNVRWAVLDGAGLPTVLVVTASGDLEHEAFYVNHALATQVGGHAKYQTVGRAVAQLATTESRAASGSEEGPLADNAVVVLLSTRGLERKGRDAITSYVRSGGGIFIAAGPDIDGEVVATVLGDDVPIRIVKQAMTESGGKSEVKPARRTLAPADLRHPVFQAFASAGATLGLVTFRDAARVDGSSCQPLARFTTGEAALIECVAGEGRALVLASDLGNRWNDFPLHATFVPFLNEAVHYLASTRARGSEYVVGDVPRGIPSTPGVHAVGEGAANGGTRMSQNPGSRSRHVAVNVDPREGDPTRISADDFQSAVTRLKDTGRVEAHGHAQQQEDRQHLWQYLLVLMVMTLAVEGFVASRTA